MDIEAARDAVGRRVRYSPAPGQVEYGTVRGTSGQYVMVCYESSGTTKATAPKDIELVDIHLPLGPPRKFHHDGPARQTPCSDPACLRRHVWEARCQCGESVTAKRRLHAVNEFVEHAHRAAREASR